MKIIFISSRSLSNIGGIETYMSNLCPMLAEKGHDVVLYTEGEKYEEKDYKGVKVISFPAIKSKFLNKIVVGRKATRHALKHHRDADIFHYNAMAAGLSSWIPVLRKKNVVFQGHGFEWQRAKWTSGARKVIRALDNFCLRVNKNITMVSQDQSDFVQNKFGKECVTITPGIHIPNKEINETEILKRFNLKPNEYILYLGRLVPEKKADVLINAYQKAKLKGVKLVIAGDDPTAKNYIAKCKKFAESNEDIIFTGAVYGDDKEYLLRQCMAFVIPSELEGLPITLLEAMSYSKICIASNIPACKEALADNGIYFNVNDDEELSFKLKDICLNISSNSQLGELNYDRVKEKFTWEKITNKYEEYCFEIYKN